MVRTPLGLLLAVPLVACQGAPPEADHSVRDSADIRIVESTAAARAEGEAWTVGAEPMLHIRAAHVRQIGPDFLLGIWTDDLDVRYIRKYALAR